MPPTYQSLILFLFFIKEPSAEVSLLSSQLSPISMSSSLHTPQVKIRHRKQNLVQSPRGKYTTKVEIQKAETDDHPCRLEKTTVKIQFPDMKTEIFVNFLGYKEPNLMYLLRCKGVCNRDAESQVACGPTTVRQKKVKMMIKTQLIGRDPSIKMKELLLEEHVSCGCQCQHISPNYCTGTLNNSTCECECDDFLYGQERQRCESRTQIGYWDTVTCKCLNKTIAPRGVDYYHNHHSPDCTNGYGLSSSHDFQAEEKYSNTEVLCWVLLGGCITVCIFLSATTFYYRRKIRNVLYAQNRNKERRQKTLKAEVSNRRKRNGEPSGEENIRKESLKVFSKPPRSNDEAALEEILLMQNLTAAGELYHEQYNEHGVRIEKELSDNDLIQKYFG